MLDACGTRFRPELGCSVSNSRVVRGKILRGNTWRFDGRMRVGFLSGEDLLVSSRVRPSSYVFPTRLFHAYLVSLVSSDGGSPTMWRWSVSLCGRCSGTMRCDVYPSRYLLGPLSRGLLGPLLRGKERPQATAIAIILPMTENGVSSVEFAASVAPHFVLGNPYICRRATEAMPRKNHRLRASLTGTISTIRRPACGQ